MPNPRLAHRYAKSLIDIANENGVLEDINVDMEYLQALIRISPEFRRVLASPIIKEQKKFAIVSAVAKPQLKSKITAAFFELLLKKNRESNLPEIVDAFKEQYNELKGISSVKLVTAHPASEEMKALILNKLATEAGLTNVLLETKVDEKLIGGFMLEYNNKIVDATIKNDLDEIKKSFLNNEYIFQVR